jgi:hypothetical protein
MFVPTNYLWWVTLHVSSSCSKTLSLSFYLKFLIFFFYTLTIPHGSSSIFCQGCSSSLIVSHCIRLVWFHGLMSVLSFYMWELPVPCAAPDLDISRLSLSILVIHCCFTGPPVMAQCHDGHYSSWSTYFKPVWQFMWIASFADARSGATAGCSTALTLRLQVAVHHLTTDDLHTQVGPIHFI